MPNWCENKIRISGNVSEISKIIQGLNGDDGVFESLLPISMNKEEYDNYWHSYNIENWGTKWDISKREDSINYLNIEDDFIELFCQTAWAPPIEFCEKLTQKYSVKLLEIDFFESGMDFSGRYIWENGTLVYKKEYTYLIGLYLLDKDVFWQETEYIATYNEDDKDEYLKRFSFFASKSDLEKIEEIYDNNLNQE